MLTTQNLQNYADEQVAIRDAREELEHKSHLSLDSHKIVALYQTVFDTAMDAHMQRKIKSVQEGMDTLLQMTGLMPMAEHPDRDFLTGENT